MASGVMMVVVKAGDWRPPVTTYASVADAWPTHKAADTRGDVSGPRESPARLRHHQFFQRRATREQPHRIPYYALPSAITNFPSVHGELDDVVCCFLCSDIDLNPRHRF